MLRFRQEQFLLLFRKRSPVLGRVSVFLKFELLPYVEIGVVLYNIKTAWARSPHEGTGLSIKAEGSNSCLSIIHLQSEKVLQASLIKLFVNHIQKLLFGNLTCLLVSLNLFFIPLVLVNWELGLKTWLNLEFGHKYFIHYYPVTTPSFCQWHEVCSLW